MKADELASDAVAQDTVYLGARLSVEDPDNITFRSTFNLEADRIGVGSAADPVAIACGKNFYDIICAGLTAGNDLSGQYFELTENINFQMPEITTDKGWEPPEDIISMEVPPPSTAYWTVTAMRSTCFPVALRKIMPDYSINWVRNPICMILNLLLSR